VLSDVRYALRALRNNPGFTAIALVTLALGIGANTAIFSVVSAVLLRPLPFPQASGLVQINETNPPFGVGAVSYPDLEDYRKQSHSFEAVITYIPTIKNLQGIVEPERIAAVAAERGLFGMLGVNPIAGRTFREDDPPNVVVIGAGFWKRHYAADPALIGRKISLDGESYTVIGVMPGQFQFPYRATYTELWIPWKVPPEYEHNRSYQVDAVTARLKPGVTIDAARTELNVIAGRLQAQYPETNTKRAARLTPLSEVVTGRVRNSLFVLLGAVVLVLLVACANVANLLLARATARTREIAVRAALGASRLRLMRAFLTESILLALGGGLLGLAVADWGAGLLLKLAGAQIPRSSEINLDWHVFAYLLAVCVLTGIGFGLAPAIASARADVQRGLKESRGRGITGIGGLRDGLVVAEIALAFVLLIGAGLLLRAFLRLQATPTGLVAENVLTLHITGGADASRYIPSRLPVAELRYVTPGYFRALGIPLRKGRGLTGRDTHETPRVVLINEALARRYFPNENPVGRQTDRGTVVGVVGDVRQAGLDRPPVPEIYYPVAQNVAQTDSGMVVVVCAKLTPERLVSAVRAAIHEVDPSQTIFNIKTMQRVIADSLSDFELYLWLIGLFAALAVTLAAAGIYGVVSYTATLRTHEVGIRMALGAAAGDVLRLILRRTLLLAGGGIILGSAGALAATRVLAKLLFEVKPTDPATFASVAALIACMALMAALLPARRASKVDPVEALRYE
jgi:putative ABC transport system permease protein